jgi:hypothetical protein
MHKSFSQKRRILHLTENTQFEVFKDKFGGVVTQGADNARFYFIELLQKIFGASLDFRLFGTPILG